MKVGLNIFLFWLVDMFMAKRSEAAAISDGLKSKNVILATAR